MLFLPEVREITQAGVEVTAGTKVAANKRFHGLTFDIDPKKPSTEVRQAGNLFPTGQVPGKGKAEITGKGAGEVQDLIYLLSTWKTPTFAVAGTLSHKASFPIASLTPNLRKSLTFEKGSPGAGNAISVGYGTMESLELDFVFDKGVTVSSKLTSNAWAPAQTLTDDPDTLAESVLFGTHIDVYIATSVAGLPAGQVDNLSAKFKVSKLVGDVYTNRSSDTSFSQLVETAPDMGIDFVFPASTASRAFVSSIDTATLYYARIVARGAFLETVAATDYYNELAITMPIRFTNPGEGAAQDIHTVTLTGNAQDVSDFNTTGGAVLIEGTSLLSAL